MYRCLACDSPTAVCGSYSGRDMAAALAKAVGRPASWHLDDYLLERCTSCGLEQANPMREPPAAFYEWMNEGANLYHHDRWEWHELGRQLHADDRLVVDVGCGSGAFLAYMKTQGRRAVGLELSERAVVEARAVGLDVVHGSLGAARTQLPRANVVTMWHVVEHVADPVGVLRGAAEILAPGGRIFFSFPASPMSAEVSFFDPFNHPPHHLTRWTPEAVNAMAGKLGMVARIHLPQADTLLVRWARGMTLQALGPYSGLSPAGKAMRLAAHVARHPMRALRDLSAQARRRRYKGVVLSDVMMVELSPAA